jgi:beta-barrel assembly-enhancing protease
LDSEGTVSRPGLWDGSARFFDGKEAKARSVSVIIRPEGLEISGGDAFGVNGLFPPGDLRLLEKHGLDLVQLEIASMPGSMLEIRDPHAFRWLETLGFGGKRPLAAMSLSAKAGSLLAVLFAVAAFMYFIGLDLAVEGALAVIPPKVDRMLGDAAAETLYEKASAPGDGMARRALERSTAAVVAMTGNPADSIRIRIVADTSIMNAFAFPGGTILVYTGMLRLLEDQEEWLALLAHEAGHVHLRHGMRGIVRGSILGIGLSLLFGDLSGISAVVMDNAGTLLNLKYGRGDETAADDFARERMSSVGYPPGGLASLFRKILELQKQPAWAAFLSTHPATEARIERLRIGTGAPAKASPLPLTPEEWAALRKL